MKSRVSIILFSLVFLLSGCGSGGNTSDNGAQPIQAKEWYDFQGFMYNVPRNVLKIFDHEVANVYQVRTSPDGKTAIYSVVLEGLQPDLYIASENSPDVRRVTFDEYLNFDPAINNFGDYAYARHDNSVAMSKVFVNNSEVDLPAGLYKNLALHNSILVMHYANYYDETDWLVIYDIASKSVSKIRLDIAPDFISFQSDTKIILQGLNNTSYKNEILVYDIAENIFSYLKKSDDADYCYLDNYRYGENVKYVCFAPAQTAERLLFLGLRHLRENDPTGALACSNNYLGRLSWNMSYRLQGLLALRASGVEVDYPLESIIKKISDCLVGRVERDANNLGWPTKKYSITGTDKLSLLVDDAMILYPLLQVANDNLVDEINKRRIISLAEEIYYWHEPEYDSVTRNYHFKKGISYWADGLWLPYNMQNVFGLALIELYKATNDEKYKSRALELAARFRSEWVHLDDGRNVWHYWPNDFYAGWSAEGGLSVNTPSRAPATDNLYEDVSHAGLNVKFIYGIYSGFAESPFSANDMQSLGDTLQGFRYGNIYSRFIGGDVAYQPASRRHVPTYGWMETEEDLLIRHVSQGIPFIYPLFEGDMAMTYFMSLNNH